MLLLLLLLLLLQLLLIRLPVAGIAAAAESVDNAAPAAVAVAAADDVADTSTILTVAFIMPSAISTAIAAFTAPLRPSWPPLLVWKPAAKAWLPWVPFKLLLSSSTQPRPPFRSARLKSVLNAKLRFSGAYAGGDHSVLDD